MYAWNFKRSVIADIEFKPPPPVFFNRSDWTRPMAGRLAKAVVT
jgi:hypothetical protein